MLKRIHHIDYVVRDLDRAIEQYRRVLGVDPGPKERLESWGVQFARFKVGETWVILVQPLRDDSRAQAYLDRHGEGFFHIAYEVEGIEAAAATLKQKGVKLLNETPRRGLEGWKLVDIDVEETLGVVTQLAEPLGDEA